MATVKDVPYVCGSQRIQRLLGRSTRWQISAVMLGIESFDAERPLATTPTASKASTLKERFNIGY
jgi:hypothetical protein